LSPGRTPVTAKVAISALAAVAGPAVAASRPLQGGRRTFASTNAEGGTMLVRALATAAVLSLLVLVPTTAAASGGAFKVTSPLDGKSVLPHRIHWLAYPSLSHAKVAKVEFGVDGRLAWVEHQAPYVYGSDDNGRNEGYLVTSWLSAGKHRFVVRATSTSGRTSTDAVVARVLPAPAPPSALAGSWQRTVDATGAPKPGSRGNPTSTIVASGRWTITFEKRWVRDSAPGKFIYPRSNTTGLGLYNLDDYTATASRINVVGEVIFHPVSDKLPEGGWWCYPNGPAADYNWTVSGNTLTLSPVGGHDACGIRGFVWTGSWTRVG
jgi:hypothetical protein